MAGSYAEQILTAKLREGLWEAIIESDIVGADDIDSIRFQKLLLEGVEHFNLKDRVTIEWYLDGDVISSSVADISQAGNKTELESAHQFHLDDRPTVSQIVDFYRTELDESFAKSTDKGTFLFLRDYYKEKDNIPYRDLYLRNLDVDQNLSEMKHNLEIESGYSGEYVSTFRQKCRNLKIELLLHEEFNQIPPYVDAFENGGAALLKQLAEDTIRDVDSIKKLVDEYDKFYYYGLWNIIAQIIAYHNHTGPNGSNVERKHQQKLQDADEGFINRYEGIAEWMGQHDIVLPDLPNQFPSVSLITDPPIMQNDVDSTPLTNIDHEIVSSEIDLDENPEAIDMDDILSQDDPSKPLSDIIVEERTES